MFAYLKDDGRYHYSTSAEPDTGLGPLLEIFIRCEADPLDFSGTSASAEEHDEWIRLLRDNGVEVRVTEVGGVAGPDEP